MKQKEFLDVFEMCIRDRLYPLSADPFQYQEALPVSADHQPFGGDCLQYPSGTEGKGYVRGRL